MLLLVAFAAILLAACGSSQHSPAPESSSTPLPGTPTATPLPGHTGIPEVDAVIGAVLSADPARIESLLKLEQVGCAADPYAATPILPRCGSAEAPGTPHPAFAIPSCGDGGWVEGQDPWIDSLLMRKPAVYAVYQQQPKPANPPNGFPSGRFVIIWQYTLIQGDSGVALEVTDGRIVTESGPCGRFPGQLVEGVPLASFVLPPAGGLPTPTPTPAVRHTGNAANDRLIDAFLAGDYKTITAAFDSFPEPCMVNPQGVGSPPPCPPGVPTGGTAMTTRVLACERGSARETLFRQIFRFGYELYAAFPSSAMPATGPYQYSRDWVPPGDLVVVLREQGAANGSSWNLSNGRLVGARLGCGTDAASFVKDVPASAFILAPLP